MKTIPFTRGLHQLTDHVYAYLMPDGSWGLSNAGLLVNGNTSLLIDTQYDLALTARLQEAIEPVIGKGPVPRYLVNTHANGDHYFGNSLFAGAEIIASEACAREMRELPPWKMALFTRLYRLLGPGGSYFHKHFMKFKFSGIKPVYPTVTFSREKELKLEGLAAAGGGPGY